MPTEADMEAQLNLSVGDGTSSESKWPGMTYEQGVENTLRWVLEQEDTPPMEDEE